MVTKSSACSREVENRGRIVIETKLDQGYYSYATGSEEIALDRVAESLYDLTTLDEILPGRVEISLTTIIAVGVEVAASKVSPYLVIEVASFDAGYEDDMKFEELLTIIGQRAATKLISRGSIRFKIELRYEQLIIAF